MSCVVSSFSLFALTLFTLYISFFFFNDTATTDIYTLSLHDALPISSPPSEDATRVPPEDFRRHAAATKGSDRKSTRLNSSHLGISYAVFCLKKKRKIQQNERSIIITFTKK